MRLAIAVLCLLLFAGCASPQELSPVKTGKDYVQLVDEICYKTHHPNDGSNYRESWGSAYRNCLLQNMNLEVTEPVGIIQEWDYEQHGVCAKDGFSRIKLYGESYCNIVCNSTTFTINISLEPDAAIPAYTLSGVDNCTYKCYGAYKGYNCQEQFDISTDELKEY